MKRTISILLAISFCAVTAPALDTSMLTIIPGRGVGAVTIGVTKAEVIRHFGKPTRPRPFAERAIQYKNAVGITFSEAGKVSLISCGWWCFSDMEEARENPFLGTIEGGFKFGAKKEDVLNHYGKPERTRVVSEEEQFESYYYAERGIIISFREDRLAHVTVFAPKKKAESKAE